jgi:putative Holliday junction resolvase
VPRILGIDYGTRRLGLALSDPSATIAQPLPTLTRRAGKRAPVQALANIVQEQEVTEIVIGLPLSLSGAETEWTAEVREFGAKLAQRTSVPVAFLDERMTSVQAEKTVRSLGLRRSEREQKERVDAAAALLILQAYLDRRARA